MKCSFLPRRFLPRKGCFFLRFFLTMKCSILPRSFLTRKCSILPRNFLTRTCSILPRNFIKKETWPTNCKRTSCQGSAAFCQLASCQGNAAFLQKNFLTGIGKCSFLPIWDSWQGNAASCHGAFWQENAASCQGTLWQGHAAACQAILLKRKCNQLIVKEPPAKKVLPSCKRTSWQAYGNVASCLQELPDKEMQLLEEIPHKEK